MVRQIRNTDIFSEENRWFIPLFSELTVTNLTHFGGLAILAVYLSDNLHFLPHDTALLLVVASLGLRGGRVALAPFIDRIAPRKIIPAAILLSITGYLGMLMARDVWQVAPCLLCIGIGYGVNSMLVTTLASYTAQRSGNSFAIYALMNTGVNLAASVAPMMFNSLRLGYSPQAPFGFAALILCASLVISMRIRVEPPHIYRETRFIHAAGSLLTTPRYLAVLTFIAIGWAINTQKFSATPLFIAHALDRPEYVGLAVALQSFIGLLVSLPAGSFVRFHNIKSRDVLSLCFLFYAAGYGVISLFPTLPGLWSGLILWSIGESFLMPQLNTLIAEYTRLEHRLAGFSLAAVAIGVGEASGNAAGVALLTGSLSTGHVWICYAILASAAIVACGCARLLHPQSKTMKGIPNG